MEAGRLDRRIQLLRPVQSRDAMNEVVPGFAAEGGPVPAGRLDVSDGERVRAAQAGYTLSSRWRVRRDQRTDLIDTTWQLQEGKVVAGAFVPIGKRQTIQAKKELLSHAEFGRVVGYELSTLAAADGPPPLDDA
jgi:head-tail adaptor